MFPKALDISLCLPQPYAAESDAMVIETAEATVWASEAAEDVRRAQ